jgi:hypothetical protein
MAIEIESTLVNRWIGGTKEPGTVDVNLITIGVLGRVRLSVNVLDRGDANANHEAARRKMLYWTAQMMKDLQSPLPVISPATIL